VRKKFEYMVYLFYEQSFQGQNNSMINLNARRDSARGASMTSWRNRNNTEKLKTIKMSTQMDPKD